MEDTYKHTDLTNLIIKAFYAVYNNLGYGFLEKVYVNSLAIEMQRLGLKVVEQAPISIYYQGQVVGDYYADLLVNNLVIAEIKAAVALVEEHEAQLLNYLKATAYEVGLLLNFGPEPQVKRKAFENTRKGTLSWTKKATT
ncbi:MAG: GxxExxY protein [Acidobacteria bacterium]|nr:MAG: GxxExxY protein [Acidobacteriota bacterium]